MDFHPRVVAIVQRKGGVGKTTTARYVAEYLARKKKLRVLSLDLDNQCNLSSLLLNMDTTGKRVRPPIHPEYDPSETDWNGRGSTADLYISGDLFAYDVTRPSPIPNWNIVPGDAQQLENLERHDDDRIRNAIIDVLRDNIALNAMDYDVIVIDTGPTSNSLLRSAVRAATHLIIPFAPEPQCGKGLGEMVGIVRSENELRRNRFAEVELLGILPTMVENTAVHQDILASMEAHPAYKQFLMPFRVPRRTIFQQLDSSNPTPSSIFDATRKEHEDLKHLVEGIGKYVYDRLYAKHAATREAA